MVYARGCGFGFRGTSPAWPYIGRGRGGLPRCSALAPTREEELGFLKNQADVMKRQLQDIEHRMRELEKKE